MNTFFSHPDFCGPVFRRCAETALMDALAWYGDFLLSRGRTGWRQQAYRSRTGYWNAVRRLRRQGIVAYRRRGARDPVLRVDPSHPRDQAVHDPESFWNRRWKGYWHVLVYDIPESNRRYRDHLRRILSLNRCGYLQGSVWISTRDLRPLFADLDQAAALGSMAHLFEARTVLGHDPRRLVQEAWDFDRLHALHQRFREDVQAATAVLEHRIVRDNQLAALAHREAAAFRTLIECDPMLPAALHPPNYAGREMLDLHRRFIQKARKAGNRP